MFHRCIPVEIACYAEFAQELVTFISDNNVFRRVIAGLMASKEIILGLCLLALGTGRDFIGVTLCVCVCVFACLKMYLCFSGKCSSFYAMRGKKTTNVNTLMRIFLGNNRKCLCGFLLSIDCRLTIAPPCPLIAQI